MAAICVATIREEAPRVLWSGAGLHRRRTSITAARLPIGAGEVLTTEAGMRPAGGTARMGAEATMAVDGAIPSVAAGHCCDCRR
jgi:hypothetical protein